MSGLRRAWSWSFHIDDPKDPKFHGWLHPSFALLLNLGLAFAVAISAFLATPYWFRLEWLREQPHGIIRLLQGVQQALNLAKSVKLGSAPDLTWLKETIGHAFVFNSAIFDEKQALALYSWEGSGLDPQILSTFLLVYVALMLSCRLCEKGPVMLYDMVWACNMSMVLTAVAIRLNIPFLVSACSCWVALDQLLWYADSLSLLIRGRFLIGVAKYIANKNTPWTKKLFSTHHLWFIPFTTYINLKCAAGHSPCCLPVSAALSLVCVLGSRCCTPYAVYHAEQSVLHTERSKNQLLKETGDDEGKGSMDVLNVNVSWRCWSDVAHHIPLLGIFDDKPWYMFVAWNQLVWGLGNCFLFGIFLTAANIFRCDH